MSKGLGGKQRLVLDALKSMRNHEEIKLRRMDVYAIEHFRKCGGKKFTFRRRYGMFNKKWRCTKCHFARGYTYEMSAAEKESLRRAIRTLAKAGLVEAGHEWRLEAWLPLTAKEKKQSAKQDRAQRELPGS